MRLRTIFVLTGFAILCVSPIAQASVSTDSLEGYWKLDDGSGTSAIDSSGHSRTGTLTNTPTWAVPSSPTITFTDPYGLSFNKASSEYVNIGSTATSGAFPRTYSVWINTSDAVGSTYRTFLSEGNSGSANPSVHLQLVEDSDATCTTDDSFKAYISDDANNNAQLCSSTAFNDGAWHHIALVSSAGNSHELFVDGTSVDTDTTSLGATTFNSVVIGALQKNGLDQYYDGQVDDVRIYTRALSDSEISVLAGGNHTAATWDGSTDTDWETDANWDIGSVPDPFNHIFIPDTLSGPVLGERASGASLTIEANGFTGSYVDLHGFDFELVEGGELHGGGTLRLLGSESMNIANLGTASTGSVLYYGTGSYTGLAAGDSYNDLFINDGLLGYWNFDALEGSYLTDSSGYDRDATRVDSPNDPSISSTTAPTDYFNRYSMEFDGNDYITLGDVTFLDGLSEFSVSAWYHVPDTSGQYAIAAKWVDGSLGNARNFLIDVSGGNLRGFGPGTSSVTSSTSTTANQWHHVTFVKTSTTQLLYHDGFLADSDANANSVTNNTEPLLIGAKTDSDTVSAYLDGFIDDVRIYDRPLRAEEVSALSAGHMPATASGTFTLDANLAIANNLILASGDLDVSGTDYAVTASGSWLNYGGQFSPQSGTVTLEGSGDSDEEIRSGGQAFNNLTFTNSSTWTLRDLLDVDGVITLSSATIDASTDSYSIHAHDFDQASGTVTPRSGLVVLNGSSNVTFTFTSTLNELQIEDPTEDGLVGYWKLDECQGNSVIDSSGTGNDGTLAGTAGPPAWSGSGLPTAISFDNPCALNFDAEDRVVEIPDDNTLDLGDEFTLSGWAKFDDFDETYMFLISKDGATNSDDTYAFGARLQKLYVAINDGSWAEYSANTTLVANVWYHLAGVRNADDTLDLYVDGVLDGTFTSVKSPKNVSTPVTLGQRDQAALELDGTIDDLRIYNRSLTPIEVRRLANGQYANGALSTATFTLGGNLDLDTMTILSGVAGAASRTLDVSGDWNNYAGSGSFTEGTSTVDFDGSSTQNVRGSTEFYNLEASTTSTQTINFGSGTTQFISNLLTLTGQASNLLTLAPLTTAIEWLIDLGASATQSISYLSVSYSDASEGEEIDASDGTSTDGGNTTNWNFGSSTTSTSGNGGWRSNKQAISKSQGGSEVGTRFSSIEAPTLAAVGIADDVTEGTKNFIGGILDPSMRTYIVEDPSRRVKEVLML